MSRLPEVKGDNKTKKKFKLYPIGYFHIDIAEVKTEEGIVNSGEVGDVVTSRRLPTITN